MKNLFKKSSIVDTLVNVGIGGAANVAMDYAVTNIGALASLGDTTVNAIKIAVGALAGSMTSNKYLRAATDGIATVGVSNLVKGYIGGDEAGAEVPAGVPFIGKVKTGQRNFRIARDTRGAGAVPFMG